MSYRKKDNIRLTYMENEKRLKLEGRLLLERVLNEALAEMGQAFDAALQRGELLQVHNSSAELREYLRLAAEKHLQAPVNAKLKK